MGPHHTTTTNRRSNRVHMEPVSAALNIFVWICALIVMGITAYLISTDNTGWSWSGAWRSNSHVQYEITIAVLTVVFYLAAFVLPGVHYSLLFNIIFSHLWIVAVAFVASDWTYSDSSLLHAAEAFAFLALYVVLVPPSLVPPLWPERQTNQSANLFRVASVSSSIACGTGILASTATALTTPPPPPPTTSK
jgi:hypothetical protein